MPEQPPLLEPLTDLPVRRPVLDHPRPWLVSVATSTAGESRSVAHISNIEYVRWLDRGAELHLDHLGWSRLAMHELGTMWFVARHEIDYRAEVHADEHLVLATWVRDLRRSKSWRDTVIWRPGQNAQDDPVVVCTASTLWVHVDLATRRPCRVAADMAAALDPLHPPRLRRSQDDPSCT